MRLELRSSFLKVLKWELFNLSRFPIPELILTAGIFITLQAAGVPGNFGVLSGNEHIEKLSFEGCLEEMNNYIGLAVSFGIDRLFLSVALFSVILSSLAFSYEMESGLMAFYLSQPVGRAFIFISKALIIFLINFSACLFSFYFTSVLLVPRQITHLLKSGHIFYSFSLISLEIALFSLSLSVLVAILTQKLSFSVTIGVALILILQAMDQTLWELGFKYLPPTSVKELIFFTFVPAIMPNPPKLSPANVIRIPFVTSLLMSLVAYYQFVTRYEAK